MSKVVEETGVHELVKLIGHRFYPDVAHEEIGKKVGIAVFVKFVVESVMVAIVDPTH